MQTSKNFYRHVSSGDIYAVEMSWSGHIVGSAGPLAEDALTDLQRFAYAPDKNDWLHSQNDNLILV